VLLLPLFTSTTFAETGVSRPGGFDEITLFSWSFEPFDAKLNKVYVAAVAIDAWLQSRTSLEAEAHKMRYRPAVWWIGAALAANLVLAAIILVTRGAGVPGTETALRATARVSFLWFWLAYTGGALTILFRGASRPLKQHGREFGLAFAAALLVHLILVGWLCWIGAAPEKGVFIFFGTAAAFTFLLASLSFGNLHTVRGLKWLRLLRIIAMNFILFAFFKDFMRDPLNGEIKHLVEYLPYAVMTIVAPLLRLTVWGIRLRVPSGSGASTLLADLQQQIQKGNP
jgi:hypothetical protein